MLQFEDEEMMSKMRKLLILREKKGQDIRDGMAVEMLLLPEPFLNIISQVSIKQCS